ncbi:MAG: hypothetical protein ACLFWL_19095 [Candidatus Brocadiia bacterium]
MPRGIRINIYRVFQKGTALRFESVPEKAYGTFRELTGMSLATDPLHIMVGPVISDSFIERDHGIVKLDKTDFRIHAVHRESRGDWGAIYTRGVGLIAVLQNKNDTTFKKNRKFFRPFGVNNMVITYRLIYYCIPGEKEIEWFNGLWLKREPGARLRFTARG